MTEDQKRMLPFSQRTGLATIPPQLKIGEVSDELRRLLWYAVYKDFVTCTHAGYIGPAVVSGRWEAILRDMQVRVFKQFPDRFSLEASPHERQLKQVFTGANLGPLFDCVEFLLNHPEASKTLRNDIADAFVQARAAYRVVDGATIVAVGSEEQAAAMERAITDAEKASAVGSRKHLVEAGKALAQADWPGSVRESIHAVESIVVQLAVDQKTLGSALSAMEAKGYLHGALKKTFSTLYGYASDEEGVRHALVFKDEAKVDEADALFMLGACASFVSYLISRGTSAGLLEQMKQ